MKNHLKYVIGILLVVTGVANAQVPPVNEALDHFKCYFPLEARVLQQEPPVQLQDQFDIARNEFETVKDMRIVRFCNPVEKTRGRRITPIIHPTHHLTMFLINPQPIIPREVVVRNQFGVQHLDVRDPQVLAVPTGKSLTLGVQPTPPTDLDHYKCYNASGRKIGAVVRLRDQFHTELVRVLEPMGFCNPVRKIHGDRNVGVQNAKDHLTCYTITPTPFQGTVVIANQFGLGPVSLAKADILCVPSQKVKWEEVLPPREAEADQQ